MEDATFLSLPLSAEITIIVLLWSSVSKVYLAKGIGWLLPLKLLLTTGVQL